MARKRNATYPDSVQPGMPVLGPLPEGWVRESLGKRLHEIKRPIKMRDECIYNLVTVKRSRGGAVKRDSLQGKNIKVKSQFEVHVGDFLISKRQIVHGACALVPEELHGAIVSNEYSILGSKKDLDLTFLRYLSETKYFQETCFHSSIGVHVEKMVFKLDRWFKWEFNFPPQKEQKKITRILTTWDAAITCTQELLENSKQQKKTLMQQLLTGGRRLPGFHSAWEMCALSQLAHIEKGKALNGDQVVPGQFPVIAGGQKSPYSHNVFTHQNAITISASGAYAGFIAYHKEKFWGSDCSIIQSKSGVDILFLFFSLLINQKSIYLLQRGGAQPHVYPNDIALLTIPAPPLDEQKAIAKVLSAADALIAQYEGKLAHLQKQKKALMQQLLTGKIRVTLDTPDATSDTSGDACETPA